MICAIVLAAGRSERMGTQKLLLPLDGRRVITRIVDELSLSQIDEIVVVIGKDGEQLRAALVGKPVRFVENLDAASEMLGSVRRGLRAMASACRAALVVLGDQPGLTRALVDELIRRLRSGESTIVVPGCNGHRGHPVLFDSQYFAELLTRHDDEGLRGLLNAHPNEISTVPVADVTAMEDMDTPADYERQKKLFSKTCYAETGSPP